MARARKLTTSGRDRGRPLADFLAERLGVDRAEAEALARAGGVYVGRRRAEEPERPLEAGERVVVHAAAGGETDSPSVVYRDREVLVVEKPAGVPSQATRESALGALDRLVARDEPGARPLHRLDRDASGLVLFTRTPAARQRFARLLGDGALARSYVAVVRGHLSVDAARFDRPIGPDPSDRRRMSAGHGRPALTHVRVARRGQSPSGEPTSLLEIDLSTGRTHQIRIHLADAGHPLCGDHIYGSPDSTPRLCLHACRLAWPPASVVTSAQPALFDSLVAARP